MYKKIKSNIGLIILIMILGVILIGATYVDIGPTTEFTGDVGVPAGSGYYMGDVELELDSFISGWTFTHLEDQLSFGQLNYYMQKLTYDADEDGDIDVTAGGTEKSSWTLYAIPYLSGVTAFGEIPIGTAEYALTVNAGATGYDWTLFDLSLYYLKTEIDTFSELQSLIADKTLVNEEDVFTIDADWVNTANPWVDNEVADDITIDLATLATTFTCTDNENEALNCPLVFVDGATGAQGAETDGDLHYNPSTGTLTATTHAGAGGGLTVLNSAYTIDNALDAGLRNGIYSGLVVTDVSGINISWTSGVAFVDGSVFAVDANASEDIADNATTYLYILKDNSTMQESVTEPVVGVVGEFALVCVLHTYATDIHEKFDFPYMSGELRYDLWKFLDDITPTATVGGCNTIIDTDATLANDFTIATGTYYVDVFDLNTISSILYSSTATHDGNGLTAFYHVASAWSSGAENGVNFSQWDNGTAKASTVANKWYVAWIYVEDGDTIEYVYPQTQHDNEGSALAEGAVYPPHHQGIILPSARFIFRHGVSAFGATSYFVDTRPFFGYSDGGPIAQMIYQTVTGDSGSTTATASDDSIAIVGSGIAVTAVTADTVTITATEVDPTVDSDTKIKAILVDEVTKTGDFTAGRLPEINNATGIIEQSDIEHKANGGYDFNANSAGFTTQTAVGDGDTTCDWRIGPKFRFVFGAQGETFTFTNPEFSCHLQIILIQDETGGRGATWPDGIYWATGTIPTLSTAGNARDIVNFFFDDQDDVYYGIGINFAIP